VENIRTWGNIDFQLWPQWVRNFLLSQRFFLAGKSSIRWLRFDCRSVHCYILDYSRKEGQWFPILWWVAEIWSYHFLQEVHTISASVLILAVFYRGPQNQPIILGFQGLADMGGLWFSMKMEYGGCMTFSIYHRNRIRFDRRYHHDSADLRLLYALYETCLDPFSDDEVVHGKGSMRYKNRPEMSAAIRLIYDCFHLYVQLSPGKKLLFMGAEFGQGSEWNTNNHLNGITRLSKTSRFVTDIPPTLNKSFAKVRHFTIIDFDAHGLNGLM